MLLCTDTILQKEKKMANIGVKVMDNCGNFLSVFSIPIQFVEKNIIAEVLADHNVTI